MFKVLYNQARIGFSIEPVTPILIKAGGETFDPTKPDMEFVKTSTKFGDVPYLPGSSLKGVIRSHAERILRTLNLKWSKCDITQKGMSCTELRSGGSNNKKLPYSKHCFACRTFGSTELASRTRFTDAYPWSLNADREAMEEAAGQILLESRTSAKIDRSKGVAAGGALFSLQVVSAGQFYSEVSLRNYQLWQIALLAIVLRDINAGHQRLGASKSRGLGKVKIVVTGFEIQQFGSLADDGDKLKGVGCINQASEYDLIPKDELSKLDVLNSQSESLISVCFRPADDPDQCWLQMASQLVSEGGNWSKLLERKNSSEGGNPQ